MWRKNEELCRNYDELCRDYDFIVRRVKRIVLHSGIGNDGVNSKTVLQKIN